jgi:hypothetical protein
MNEPKKKTSSIKFIALLVVVSIPLLIFIVTPNFVRSPNTAPRNACINNLRQIDGAKQQWALEDHRSETDTPTIADVARYLKGKRFPKCYAGGKYTIGRVNEDPKCSIQDHALPPSP